MSSSRGWTMSAGWHTLPRLRFTTDTRALKQTLADYRPHGINRMELQGAMASPFVTRGAFHTDEKTIVNTLGALKSLAQILAGYPGRKNLIWISEAFPVSLFADGIAQSGMNSSVSVETGRSR